jgi:hypothetical protein
VGGRYRFHHGYWARHIGFYGGINYGFGYFGVGYEGGYWNGPHFYYNTVITHVNRDRVRDVYVHNVTVNREPGRVSFNGGRGGLQVRPRPAELSALHEQRYAPMQAQVQVRDQASHNRQQFYSANHGRPAEAVATRPVTSDHRMPAEMPRVAARPEGRGGAAGAPGNRGSETARPGQVQAPGTQGRPDFRIPQRGGQIARPENTPRGNAGPETARPGQQQQGRPEFQQRGQEARPVQPQNDVHPPPAQQPQGRQQFDRRAQPPQAQPQQARPDFQQRQQQQPQAQPQRGQQGRPEFQQRQQQPQTQPQPQQQQQRQELRGQQGRPEFQQRQQQMRQQAAPQPQAQPRPQQQMRQQAPPPQAQRQAAPQSQRQAPQPQHQGGPPPQAHDDGHGGGHGGGHDQDKH